MNEPKMIERAGAALDQFVRHYPPSVRKIRREEAARAVLQAMRDPDIDMLVAGQETWMCYAAAEERSEANWRAMIDAALSSPTPSSGIGA